MGKGLSVAQDMILGAVAIMIGLILLIPIAGFVATAKGDANVSAISGLSIVLDLVVYGFGFGLVGFGVSMVALGFYKR